MTTPPPKTPPRFIPTLTEVVQPGGMSAPSHAVPVPVPSVVRSPLPDASAAPASPVGSVPVPSRTGDAVSLAAPLPAVAPSRSFPLDAAVSARPEVVSTGAESMPTLVDAPHQPLPEGFEEFMVHRVMQRVDVMLEKRLRDAIATVVQEQTRSVLPRLREEIESVVRHSVYEAVAEELASGQIPAGLG